MITSIPDMQESTTVVTTDLVVVDDADADPTTRKAEVGNLPQEHGQMHGTPGLPVVQGLTTTPTALPLAVWDTDGPSSVRVAPDELTGRITITRTGTYLFVLDAGGVLVLVGQSALTLYKVAGDVAYPAVSAVFGLVDRDSLISVSGLVAVTTGDVFELRASRVAGPGDCSWTRASLTVLRVG